MEKPLILAAARRVNGEGELKPALTAQAKIEAQGLRLTELVIDPLIAGWDSPLAYNHFRSGAAPVEALAEGYRLLMDNEADAVVIRGEDLLRSAYLGLKEQRQKLMNIYGDHWPIPRAYDALARVWLERQGMSETRFKELAQRLLDNYTRTALRRGLGLPPPERYRPLTTLFREIDCANPVVDFSGQLVLGNRQAALASGIFGERAVRVLGVGVATTAGDGPAHIDEIADYRHLREAYKMACGQARTDFRSQYRAGRALLEAYTCYPVVPLALLQATEIARDADEMERILDTNQITVTGGMNLARAPWNNPALNALIVMAEELSIRDGGPGLGMVHGNGGLGYKQGLALLGTV